MATCNISRWTYLYYGCAIMTCRSSTGSKIEIRINSLEAWVMDVTCSLILIQNFAFKCQGYKPLYISKLNTIGNFHSRRGWLSSISILAS